MGEISPGAHNFKFLQGGATISPGGPAPRAPAGYTSSCPIIDLIELYYLKLPETNNSDI